MSRSFTNSKAALVIYDADDPRRLALCNAISDAPDPMKACDVWEAAEKEALEKLQQAFWEDTKDINSREICRLADVGTLRRCCEEETNGTK